MKEVKYSLVFIRVINSRFFALGYHLPVVCICHGMRMNGICWVRI